MARRPNPEPNFDRELADLPPELRWWEWKARVEAALFAAAKPVTRETLARVVGRDCALELLLNDLREDLRGRPIELVRAGERFALHTRPAFGPAVRVAFDIPADATELTKLAPPISRQSRVGETKALKSLGGECKGRHHRR